MALALSFLLALPVSGQDRNSVFRAGLELFDNGMYESARSVFASAGEDEVCEGYSVVCALKMRTDDAAALSRDYISRYPSSTLLPRINFERALILFDDKDYASSYELLEKVKPSMIDDAEVPVYYFMRGYSRFDALCYECARPEFLKLEECGTTQYSAPARYAMGYMSYTENDFAEAEKWFAMANDDPRFKDITDFYIVECEFMNGNYDYVISKGEEIFEGSPQERQSRLARIISESYLIRGNNLKAREYYERNTMAENEKTRSDFFYAGSVLYAVEDYKGAIENYQKMGDRSDSLGQIANYQLAYSYVKTKNKVSALDCFKMASEQNFDSAIAEDSHFNYAKLAFDLNQDPQPFENYISKYPSERKGELIYSYMALSALYRHDYESAINAYDNIDELDSDMLRNYTKANYLRANQLISAGSYGDAIPYLKASIFYLPKRDRLAQLSKFWQAEANYRVEKYTDAAVLYTELFNSSSLEGMPEGEALAYNIAYCYYMLKSYDSAAKWFDTYLRSDNDTYRSEALLRRADCDFGASRYDEAIVSYGNVIAADSSPDNIYPYYQQALSYGLSKDRKTRLKKSEVLSKVLSASPDAPMYSQALYELGRAYVDKKDNASALKVFEKLVSETSDQSYRAKGLIGLGMVCRNEKKYDKALEYYKTVVSEFSGSEHGETALAAIESIYNTRKQQSKYLEYLESNGLTKDKTEAERENIYFNSAEQAFLGENYPQAVTLIENFIKKYPSSSNLANVYFYLAESLRLLGRNDKAVESFDKALEHNPGTALSESVLTSASRLLYSMERFQQAYGMYSRLYEMSSIPENRKYAINGMMNSAYKAHEYDKAVNAASIIEGDAASSPEEKKEATYILAKSLIASSHRTEALSILSGLAADADTPHGAEANYILIQDCFDRGDFGAVKEKVYSFAAKGQHQSHWLARAYIVLADSFVEQQMYSQAKATFESLRDGYQPATLSDDVPGMVKERLEKLNSLIDNK